VSVTTRGGNGYSYTSTSPAGGVTIDITPAEVVGILRGDNAAIEGLGAEASVWPGARREQPGGL